MRENLKYCVILPAFNEGRHLATVVGRIPDWVDGIIVVDDASTDDALKVAESLADPRVRVQHHEKNRGVGGAMVTGFRAALEAGYDVAIKMDADDQMDAEELPSLVRPIELGMAEYVKGNLFRRAGRPSAMPGRRWFGTEGYGVRRRPLLRDGQLGSGRIGPRARTIFGPENPKSGDHLDFLFSAFDVWPDATRVRGFFDSVFSTALPGGDGYNPDKVVLFGSTSVNL